MCESVGVLLEGVQKPTEDTECPAPSLSTFFLPFTKGFVLNLKPASAISPLVSSRTVLGLQAQVHMQPQPAF